MSGAGSFRGSLILSIIALVLTITNFLVIITFFMNRRLRTLANRFVVSLAVSDLLVSCILIPLVAWQPLSPVVGPLITFTLLASLGNICGCTYDRYTAISNPLLYSAIMTGKRFTKVMVIGWGVPLVLTVIPQIWLNSAQAFNMTLADQFRIMKIYVGFMIIAVLFICLVLICIYSYIFKIAKKHYDAMRHLEPSVRARHLEPSVRAPGVTTSTTRTRRASVKKFVSNIKATLLFAIIGVNFLLCWFLFIINNIFYAFGLDDLPSAFLAASEIFTYANSLLNPITYAFFQKEFQRAFLRLFRSRNAVAPSAATFYSNTDRITNTGYDA